MKTIDQLIVELKKINKEELTQRRFYEEILCTIMDFGETIKTEEDDEKVKQVLIEVGCNTIEEFKERAKNFRHSTIGEAINEVSTEFAESYVAQFFYGSIREMLSYDRFVDMLDEWMKKSHNISSYIEYSETSPYHKVAKTALMNWNGLSQEEAEDAINSLSIDELDEQVGAMTSMNAAINCLGEKLELKQDEKGDLKSIVYEGITDNNRFKKGNSFTRGKIKYLLENQDIVPIYMDTLFAVHDNWVKQNSKKFLSREKKHQHMPSELIGWDEVKADLMFVKPIFEALGIYVSEYSLQEEYNNRVQKYFLENHIEKTEDLVELIGRGEDFYSALDGQKDILEALKDKETVEGKVIPQIEKNGIGKVEDVRNMIIDRISYTVTDEELSRLTDEELKNTMDIISDRLAIVPEEDRENSRSYVADSVRLAKVQTHFREREQKKKDKKVLKNVENR